MTIPQTKPQTDPFEELQRDIGRAVEAATRPPAFRQAGAGVEKWGPSTTPANRNPLTALADAADLAHALLAEVSRLSEAVTGEASGPRTRQPVKLPAAFLPAIAALEAEIEVVLTEAHAKLTKLGEVLK